MDSRVMVTIGILANFIVSQSHYSVGRDYAAVASAEIQIFALGRAIKKEGNQRHREIQLKLA
jgi:hypothetical protein